MTTLRIVLAAALAMLAGAAAFAAEGDITFKPKDVDPVIFSHEHHTKYRGVKCMACHLGRFAAGGSGYKINKNTLNKREFCGHCHNGLKSFDQDSPNNCSRCHKK